MQSPLDGTGLDGLRKELLDTLVRDPKRTRRVEIQKGQDMTKGILCPDCWTKEDLIAEATGIGQRARRVQVEYYRAGHWSVWVGRCVPCDLILYVMRREMEQMTA